LWGRCPRADRGTSAGPVRLRVRPYARRRHSGAERTRNRYRFHTVTVPPGSSGRHRGSFLARGSRRAEAARGRRSTQREPLAHHAPRSRPHRRDPGVHAPASRCHGERYRRIGRAVQPGSLAPILVRVRPLRDAARRRQYVRRLTCLLRSRRQGAPASSWLDAVALSAGVLLDCVA